MTANNVHVDFVSINSYIKFGEIRSICSQDIEGKRNFDKMVDYCAEALASFSTYLPSSVLP